jgi:glycosyltransferase involved in cell wall biosynthesis
MRITWVTRSFLDYRIPVYAELDRLCGNQLTLIYNRECTSDTLVSKIEAALGDRAIGLTGEFRLATTKRKNITNDFANQGIRIPYQPGLLREISKSSPDVMVSDGFMQWTYAPLWKRLWNHKVPHVMCYERTAHTERKCQWYRRFYRKWAMNYIDAYCANGKLSGEYLEQLGAKKEQIFFGHMVADTEGLSKAVLAIPQEQADSLRGTMNISGKIFLCVGQLIPRKGIMELLKAWKQAKNDNDTLLLVGDGFQKEELQAFCRQENLNTIFTGRIPYDVIMKYYRIADVFVMPTLEDNWSLVVPEAMACGLPIACSQYNGCWPELVTSENGWVFDPLNLNDTVQMLQNIRNKPKLELQQMGKSSEQIVSRHTPATAAASIFEACEKAVSISGKQ